MNPQPLLQHFDRISEAPDAVARLRRFILDLAVCGKLVEQDPEEEPAAELLKRILIEKARLEKEGQAKKEKPLVPIEQEETPFSVPASWVWARLQDITSYIQRGKSPIYATDDGFPVVSQKCVQWRGFDLSVARLITKESIKKYEDIRFLRENDLLWNSTGTGTIGRIVRVVSPPKNLVCDSHVAVVRCALVNAEYARLWLCSDHVYQLIEGRASGSTNQVELTAQMATSQVVPVPPLAEQHRIVAKVDELMALCDQLQAAQNEREARRDRLVAASLNQIQTPDDLAPVFLDHLPRLTTRPEHVKQLRQAILNLAVRGRLVPQDLNEEPAAELLKRIQAEKNRLTPRRKDAKKNEQPNQKNLDQEPFGVLAAWRDTPFALPANWQWVAIDQIATVSSGTTPSRDVPEYYSPTGTLWVTSGETSNSFITKTAQHVSEHALKETSLKLYPPGTLIVAMYGQGKTRGQISELQIAATTNQACAAIVLKLEDIAHRNYVKLFFQKIYEEIRELAAGGAQPNLNGGKIKSTLIPFPPLAEQRRIVAKVDELMALCDQLEVQLVTTQTDSRRLCEAVLRDALAPAMEEAPL